MTAITSGSRATPARAMQGQSLVWEMAAYAYGGAYTPNFYGSCQSWGMVFPRTLIDDVLSEIGPQTKKVLGSRITSKWATT